MTQNDENLVTIAWDDPTPGRRRPSRWSAANPNPNDTEPRPVVTEADRIETLRLIAIDKARKAAREAV